MHAGQPDARRGLGLARPRRHPRSTRPQWRLVTEVLAECQLARAGLTTRRIAELLGVTRHAVLKRAGRLGLSILRKRSAVSGLWSSLLRSPASPAVSSPQRHWARRHYSRVCRTRPTISDGVHVWRLPVPRRRQPMHRVRG
jgi:hypothetical protein